MPYAVLKAMIKHPLTDVGIERFLADAASLHAGVIFLAVEVSKGLHLTACASI